MVAESPNTAWPAAVKRDRILIVTPAHNEEAYLQRTIESLARQSHLPALWIIVNDGSTDRTGEIADAAAREHAWIQVVHRAARKERSVGPGVIDAFYAGLGTADLKEFDYICKLDADLELDPGYFELLLERFEFEPRLGTASGKCFLVEGETLIPERTSDQFSLGAAKLYRRSCFEAIGGFVRGVMWDGIDCHRCRMLGWEARSYGDERLRIRHLRMMGSSHVNVLHGRIRWGKGQYFMGTHPVYLLAIMAYRMFERPWLIGGLCIGLGYMKAFLQRAPRYSEPGFRAYLHRWQMAELKGRLMGRGSASAMPSLKNSPETRGQCASSQEQRSPTTTVRR